jgi:hypothetical protein
MADLLTQIVQFLGVNCNMVNCVYPNPMEGLFYLVLLPTVLIILFVYFISSLITRKLGSYAGAKLIIAIVVYIFIVIEQWYTLFISLAQIWIILVIIIGVILFIVRHFTGKREGEFPGGSTVSSRLLGIPKKVWEKKVVKPTLAKIEEKVGGKLGEEKYVDSCLSVLGQSISQWEKTPENESENKSRMYGICEALIAKSIEGIKAYEEKAGSMAGPKWEKLKAQAKRLGVKVER